MMVIVIIFVLVGSWSPLATNTEHGRKCSERMAEVIPAVMADDGSAGPHSTRYPNVFIEDFSNFDNISAGNTTAAVKADLGRAEMWGEPIKNGDFEEGDLTAWTLHKVQGGANPTNYEVRSGSPDDPGDYYLYFYSNYQYGSHFKVISDPFIASSNYMHYWFDGYEDDEYCYGFEIFEDNDPNNNHFFEDKWCASWGGANDGGNNGESGKRTKQIPSSIRGRSCRLAIWLGEGGSGDWGRMHMDNIWLSDASGNRVIMSASLGGNITYVQSRPLVNTWKAVGAARLTFFHNIPDGTDITYRMTADGEHWVNATNGSNIIFDHIGSQLKWNATMTTTHEDIGPYIDKVIVEYDFVDDPEPHRPGSGVWTGSSTPKLEWNFTDPDRGDHQSEYLIEVFNDTEMEDQVYNSSWVNSTKPEHTVAEPLADGIYHWRVRTRDAFHGWGNYSELKRIKIDVTKPVGSIVIEEDVHSVNEQLVDLAITASDHGSGISDMQIVNDEGRPGPWEDFKTEKRVALSNSDGLKKVVVRFRDSAGIVSVDYNDTVYYDLKGPADVIVTSPTHQDQAVYYNSTSPLFQWEPPYEETEIKGYSYLVDSSQYTEPGKVLYNLNGGITGTELGEFTGFKDGSWYFHITPCDIYDQWGNSTHFRFNIDTTPPSISELKPESSRWFNITGIKVSAVFTDMDGFGLDPATIQYSYRPSGGSYSPWTSEGMEYEIRSEGIGGNPVRIYANAEVTLEEGSENAVRWRITDIAGNGPVHSQPLPVNIDRSPVTFSDPVPQEDEIFEEEEVECGITISDGAGSGVDGKTMEYSISRWGSDPGLFRNWTTVKNTMVRDRIDVLLSIEFEPGKNNFIRWRARDAVGNDHAYSEPVRVWVNSPPVPVIMTPREWTVIHTGDNLQLNATGTCDNEDVELLYYWEIKNRTTKRVVEKAWGPRTSVILDESGKHIVYLYVDDQHGCNESVKMDIDVLPVSGGGGKPGKDRWEDTTDSDGDGLPDWWESRQGMNPNDPDDATKASKDKYENELAQYNEGLLAKYWCVFALLGLLLLVIVVFLILVTRKRKDRDDEPTAAAPMYRQPPGFPRERPYQTGGRDFRMAGYGNVRTAYQSGQASPFPHAAASSGGQASTGYGYSPGHSAHPARPALPQSTQFPPQSPAPQPSVQYPGVQQPVEVLPPMSQGQGNEGVGTAPSGPIYQLPPLVTDQGVQDLNLMALPPAEGIDENTAGMSPDPSTEDVAESTPQVTGDMPVQQPGASEPPPAGGASLDSLLENIRDGNAMAPSFPTPGAEIPPSPPSSQPPSLDAPPQSSPAQPPSLIDAPPSPANVPSSPVNASPSPANAPPSPANLPAIQLYNCPSCGSMNPVRAADSSSPVTCAVCGAVGSLG